jgi:methyl-accepting chemotaxis protein
MRWKNLSIGRKLGLGFGSVLVLLAGISIYTYLGFHRVDHLAHEADKLNQNNTFILQKLIDHLNWVSTLSNLVFKEDVHTADLETDDHKCAFGKWLYSDETKELATKDKEIGQLIEAIKKPHHRLHQSAIKIEETYVDFNRKLDAMLADRWIDHLLWVKNLSQSILTGIPFTGELDPKNCNFGKWYYTYKPHNPEFAKLLKGWEEPHSRLHASAQKIVSLLGHNDRKGALAIYQQETIPALNTLKDRYEETMGWIDG